MSLNDTLYQSQKISTIFEMSQSESLHHFWWEFPPASLWEAWHPFKRPGLPLSYLKCLQMGGGGTMGQFSPWPRFISFIDNTYIFYTSYAYLFVIRSDRISRHPRNPLSVCLTHISDSTPYLLISFNSGKLGCIQVIQVSSGKFRYVQVNWGKLREIHVYWGKFG